MCSSYSDGIGLILRSSVYSDGDMEVFSAVYRMIDRPRVSRQQSHFYAVKYRAGLDLQGQCRLSVYIKLTWENVNASVIL